jgi:hypothetical protein
MTSRYDNRGVVINDDEQYANVFRRRGINFIRQYRTPSLRHPTPEEIGQLEEIGHTWALGDRYFKLADEYYGDAGLWWVIAWFNQKPTEQHVQIGETIYIPMPLERVLQYMDV